MPPNSGTRWMRLGILPVNKPTVSHRGQQRPDPGYTNPNRQAPEFFNRWGRPSPVVMMGRSPGLTFINLRGNVLGAGQIRKMWRQAVNYINAQAPYSWTSSAPNPHEPGMSYPGFQITRALRYMTRSVYVGSGIDYTHFDGLHTTIRPRVRHKPVTIGSGQVRYMPTVRNRITSFGTRVPPLNPPVQGAEDMTQ